MRSDLRLDLALLALLSLALGPAVAAAPTAGAFCSSSPPVDVPSADLACHACVLCGRAKEKKQNQRASRV